MRDFMPLFVYLGAFTLTLFVILLGVWALMQITPR